MCGAGACSCAVAAAEQVDAVELVLQGALEREAGVVARLSAITLAPKARVPVVAGVARLVLQDESVRRQEMAARRQRCREALGDAGERIAVGEVVQDFRADDQVEAIRQRIVEQVEAAPVDVAMGVATLPRALQRGLRNVGGDEMADARRQQLGEPAL